MSSSRKRHLSVMMHTEETHGPDIAGANGPTSVGAGKRNHRPGGRGEFLIGAVREKEEYSSNEDDRRTRNHCGDRFCFRSLAPRLVDSDGIFGRMRLDHPPDAALSPLDGSSVRTRILSRIDQDRSKKTHLWSAETVRRNSLAAVVRDLLSVAESSKRAGLS